MRRSTWRGPKSNSVTEALDKALSDADSTDPVPPHLRDAHYAGAAKLGHGEGYEYPHDFEGHHVEQQYRPERFEDEVYYEWTGQGRDVEVEPGTGVPVGHSAVDGSMPEVEPAPAPEAEPAPKRTLRRRGTGHNKGPSVSEARGYAERTAHPTEPRR